MHMLGKKTDLEPVTYVSSASLRQAKEKRTTVRREISRTENTKTKNKPIRLKAVL